MLFTIKEIQPNPFRNMKRYPIRKDKVETLKESLRTTGFWDNVVARVVDGKPEIAYGHHRLIALKEEFGGSRKVDLIIRDLDDDAMIKIMARENMEEWGTSATVEHETIRAVVEAFGEGKIELPKVKQTNPEKLRYAPSFIMGRPVARPDGAYTAESIAKYIGWIDRSGNASKKVSNALDALMFIEERLLSESDFEGLSTKQAEAVVQEARKTREASGVKVSQKDVRDAEAAIEKAKKKNDTEKQKLAEKKLAGAKKEVAEKEALSRKNIQKVGKGLSQQFKEGKIGTRQAGKVALELEERRTAKKKLPPDIEDFADKLILEILGFLKQEGLTQLINHLDNLDSSRKTRLEKALRTAATRAIGLADKISGENTKLRLIEGGR